jgi:hypothetical protein
MLVNPDIIIKILELALKRYDETMVRVLKTL